MRKSEKKGPNFGGALLPILRMTFLESSCNFQKFGFKKMMGIFFRLHGSSGPMCLADCVASCHMVEGGGAVSCFQTFCKSSIV